MPLQPNRVSWERSTPAEFNSNVGRVSLSGGAHGYGFWWQLMSAPVLGHSVQAMSIHIHSGNASATVRNSYIDIGVGDTTTTVMPIAEKLCGSHAATGLGRTYWLPLSVPAGKFIYMRSQDTVASSEIRVNAQFFGERDPGTTPTFSKMDCLGDVPGSTTGTPITPTLNSGGGVGVGAWTEVVASTTVEYGALMIGGLFTVDTSQTASLGAILGLGVGAPGQEVALSYGSTTQSVTGSAEQVLSSGYPIYRRIPVGSRIVVRAGVTAAAADTANSVVVYGFR